MRSLRLITLGVALTAIFLLALSLFFEPTDFGAGPFRLFAASAAILMGAMYFAAPRLGIYWSPFIFMAILTGHVIAYIVTLWTLDTPLSNTYYLLFPVLAAFAIFRLEGAMITMILSLLWLWASAWVGISTPPVEEIVLLTAAIPFAGFGAYILELERRVAERALSRWNDAHDTIDSVMSSSPDAIFSIDPLGRTEFCNNKGMTWVESVLGREPFVGRFWQGFSTELRNQFENGFAEGLQGRVHSFNFHFPVAEIGEDWEAQFSPHVDGAGVVLTLRDRSDAILREAQLEIARSKSKQETLNLITHEINTPLTPILLSAHVMRRRFQEEGMVAETAAMQTIERNVKRAMEMVADLVERSKHATPSELGIDEDNRPKP